MTNKILNLNSSVRTLFWIPQSPPIWRPSPNGGEVPTGLFKVTSFCSWNLVENPTDFHHTRDPRGSLIKVGPFFWNPKKFTFHWWKSSEIEECGSFPILISGVTAGTNFVASLPAEYSHHAQTPATNGDSAWIAGHNYYLRKPNQQKDRVIPPGK